MKNSLKKILALTLAILMLFSLTACGGENSTSGGDSASNSSGENTSADNSGSASDSEKISSKDTLVMVSPYTDTGAYNPWLQSTSQSGVITMHVLESLIKGNFDGTYEPQLAESYEWIDELTLEIKIRDDVYFHNGDKMTVEDVIFSNMMSKNAAGGSQGWRMVDTIEKIDDTTIRYNLSYGDGDLINSLAGAQITCKSYYEEVGEQAFATHPLGTGYFMWDSYTSGDNVTMKAFDKYWGEHGTIKTLTIRFISELSQALIELENGNCDMIPANGSTIDSVQGNDKITIFRYSSLLNEYLGFNYNSPEVQDTKVREAISYAIDRNALVAGAREGYAYPSYGMVLSDATELYDKNVETAYAHNKEKAKEILGELGYSTDKPLTLTLLTDTSPARTLEAQQIKNMLDEVGFKIEISTFESATVTSIYTGGDPNDYDLFIRAISIFNGAPLSAAYGILSLESTDAGNNPTWLSADSHELAEKYNALLDEAKKEIDPEIRKEKYLELQETEREMIMVCWLLCGESCSAVDSRLKGYYANYSGKTVVKDCYFVD